VLTTSRQAQGFFIETLRGHSHDGPDGARVQSRLDQVRGLWRSTGVLDATTIEERIPEVLMVAVSEDRDQVIGINTSYLVTPPALNLPVWAYRTFVDPSHRESDVAILMLQAAIEWHEARFVSGEDRSGLGVYMEVENPIIKRYRNEAVWPSTRMSFVGWGPLGEHCRVRYFEGARIS
jgi:GNAT superfamily N-acetyltransferase